MMCGPEVRLGEKVQVLLSRGIAWMTISSSTPKTTTTVSSRRA
jgi:hypothetical protein